MITQETIATTPHLPNDNAHSIAVLNQVSTMGKIVITSANTATTITIRIRFANIVFLQFLFYFSFNDLENEDWNDNEPTEID